MRALLGCANSSMRGDAIAFIAAWLTLKAPGLNCTLSTVSLIIGSLSSSSLKKIIIKHSVIIMNFNSV